MSDASNTPAAPAAPVSPATPAPRGDAIREAADARRAAAAPAAPAAPGSPPRAPGAPSRVEPRPIPTRTAEADPNADLGDAAPDLYGQLEDKPVPGAQDDGQLEDGELEEGQEPTGDDGAQDGDGDGDADGEGEFEVVALPGRRPGDPDLELELPTSDPEVIERVRQMVNGYERKADSQARLEAAHRALDSVEEFTANLRVDPVSVVERSLDPEQQAHLALRLISSEGLWQRLGPTLQAMLTDPNARTVVTSELQAEGYRLREQAQQAVAQERQATRNARDITKAVEALCPASLPAAQRQIWRQDAIAAVEQYVRQHNLNLLHPMDLPVVLSARLRASGIDPQAAAAHLVQTFTGKRPAGPARDSRPAPRTPQPDRLVQASKVRRAARAAAPGGSGAPTASVPRPPSGMGIKEAANHVRRQRGLPEKP